MKVSMNDMNKSCYVFSYEIESGDETSAGVNDEHIVLF